MHASSVGLVGMRRRIATLGSGMEVSRHRTASRVIRRSGSRVAGIVRRLRVREARLGIGGSTLVAAPEGEAGARAGGVSVGRRGTKTLLLLVLAGNAQLQTSADEEESAVEMISY
jgi:hypothetical protein